MNTSVSFPGAQSFGADYARLLFALRVAAPGDLVFVQINPPVQRQRLREQLTQDGLGRPSSELDLGKFDPTLHLDQVLRKHLPLDSSPEIVFVDGLEHWIGSGFKSGSALETLSLTRERLGELGVVVVFLLPAYLIDLIRARALNLWTWRSHYYVLDADDAMPDARWQAPQVLSHRDSGETPVARDRRSRILIGLLDDALREGRTSESVIDSLVMPLVRVLHEGGYYKKALDVLDRVRDAIDGVLDSPNKAMLLNARAVMLQALGKWNEAEPILRQALEIKMRTLGPEHIEYLKSLNNMATMYQERGNYAEAERLYRQALQGLTQALGTQHPDVTITLSNLAEICAAQGKSSEAEALLHQARAITEQILGPTHPDLAIILTNLAKVYVAHGKYAAAEEFVLRARSIQEGKLGEDHPATAETLNTLAGIYVAQGRYDDAGSLTLRVLRVLEQSLGPRHGSVGQCLNNLAEIETAKGNLDDAEAHFKQAMEILEQAIGPDHPVLASGLENYAKLLRLKKRDEDADKLEMRAREILAKHRLKHPSR